MQVRREEKEEEMRPSSLDLGARSPTYEQQISIGIPFIIHQSQTVKGSVRLDVWPVLPDRPVSPKEHVPF